MRYRSKILKVDDIEPIDGDDVIPGAQVVEVKDGKPVGEPMRAIQVSGLDVLVNYIEKVPV